MTPRRFRRAVALAWSLSLCVVRLGAMRMRGPLTPERRAVWLRACCRCVIASLGIRYRVSGAPAGCGLVVSNHLSYLDILVYSAAMPCAFVSKIEVAGWFYFGMAARAGGTIFLDRSSRASASAVAVEIADRLAHPVPILLFPEGTSTDGSKVLRFHSALFEPAVAAGAPITAAAIRYEIEGGVQERELCWFGDATFLGHLWKTLDTPGFTAEVRFAAPQVYTDRRMAASAAHAEVARMRPAAPRVESPAAVLAD